MASVFTIDGARGSSKRSRRSRKTSKTHITPGTCKCVRNPRTGRGTKICKAPSGKTRIKGSC